MKIICVSGCHDCDKKGSSQQFVKGGGIMDIYYCPFPNVVPDNRVTEYVNTKTLPDECPLEDKDDFLKWVNLNQGCHDVDEFYKEEADTGRVG